MKKQISQIMALLLIAHCGTAVVLNINSEKDQWVVQATRYVDDQYKTYSARSGVSYEIYAPEGHRFITLQLRIKNAAGVAREFDLRSINLVVGGERVRPQLARMGYDEANWKPELSAGELISRNILYAVKIGTHPDKIEIPVIGEFAIKRTP